MKNLFFILIALFGFLTSCADDESDKLYTAFRVGVQLEYPTDTEQPQAGTVVVKATAKSGSSFEAKIDAKGVANFELPTGIYNFTATDVRPSDVQNIIYTGHLAGVSISRDQVKPVDLEMVKKMSSNLVIKELYNGGCQKNDGSGVFSFDKYMILHNNSTKALNLQDVCIAMVLPYNSIGTNHDLQNGIPFYDAEGWVPAGQGFFYFKNETILEPGKDLVVVFNNANDNTVTYTNSVNLDNSEYYVTYAPDIYWNSSYHPAPSSNIPTTNYLPGFKYGMGNAWALSGTSPALFLFKPEGTTPQEFAADEELNSLYNGNSGQVRKKVPVEWVIDGIEVFTQGASDNKKRFTAAIDAGSVNLTKGQGYTLYRNVDKVATEAIEANKGKLVYDYALGTPDSTDPSMIDAEASIKKGAIIVYQDTNNTTEDFHQRSISSLK